MISLIQKCILLDKPPGLSSNKVLNIVKKKQYRYFTRHNILMYNNQLCSKTKKPLKFLVAFSFIFNSRFTT